MSAEKPLFPFVTVDVALFTIDEQRVKVLLVKREEAPYAGCWALPGGALKPHLDGTLLDAVHRVMERKLSASLPWVEEVCTFNGANRDPRGWSLSVLHMALFPMDRIQAVAGLRVSEVKWADAELPLEALAFDHRRVLERAVQHLRNSVERGALPLQMLPEKFTLTQLQKTCEIVLGKSLDKSAFRRRLKELHAGDIEEIEGEFERGVQRPAQLWKAVKHRQ